MDKEHETSNDQNTPDHSIDKACINRKLLHLPCTREITYIRQWHDGLPPKTSRLLVPRNKSCISKGGRRRLSQHAAMADKTPRVGEEETRSRWYKKMEISPYSIRLPKRNHAIAPDNPSHVCTELLLSVPGFRRLIRTEVLSSSLPAVPRATNRLAVTSFLALRLSFPPTNPPRP